MYDPPITLTLVRGLPGSGKSSHAEQIATQSEFVLASRDDHRQMMYPWLPGRWYYDAALVSRRERLVTIAHEAAVLALLLDGQKVIVHDSCLEQPHLERWAALAQQADEERRADNPRERGVKLVVDDTCLATPVGVCIARQAGRPDDKRVPEQQILAMAGSAAKDPSIPETAREFLTASLDELERAADMSLDMPLSLADYPELPQRAAAALAALATADDDIRLIRAAMRVVPTVLDGPAVARRLRDAVAAWAAKPTPRAADEVGEALHQVRILKCDCIPTQMEFPGNKAQRAEDACSRLIAAALATYH